MARLFIAVVLMACLLVVACGGDGNDKPSSPKVNDSIQREGASSSVGFVDTVTGVGVSAGDASGSLPGITVIGYGDATAQPEEVMIRLTIGQGEFGGFSSSDSVRLQIIDEAELQPVIEALKKEGVEEDSISTNTLVNSPYGFGGGSAQISFRWNEPDNLKSLFDVAEDTVRQETDHGLQNVEVLFTVKDCQPLEEEAWSAALEDGRRRAERLADLAGLELSNLVALSEAASPASIYGAASGCAALEELPSLDFSNFSGTNSASEVEVDVSLQVTFALKYALSDEAAIWS